VAGKEEFSAEVVKKLLSQLNEELKNLLAREI